MSAIPPKTIAAVLAQAGATGELVTTMVAIALAESGGELTKVVGSRRGMWLISDIHGFDRRKMVSDAAYAARSALKLAQEGRNLKAWASYTGSKYLNYVNAARQGVAQASSVSGTITAADGTYTPPDIISAAVAASMSSTGIVAPLAASYEQPGPLVGLRVTGTELTADISSSVLGNPVYEAGFGTIPNLNFEIADPEGDLLWFQRNLWVQGARVQYLDLDLRIDEIEFSPGTAKTGQLSITAIDGVIFKLRQLRGARTAKGISPTNWIRQELSLAGFDPGTSFLGEQMPTQTEIARDIPDQAGSGGEGEVPSAWTTIQRLAKETGKRVFVSGRKLVFGSAAFAMDWTSPGDLRIGWHDSPDGEKWQNLPSAKTTSIGDRSNVTEVSGRVPHNRALFFRPGASVIVHNTPSIAAGDRRFVVSAISHTLSRDNDGAEVTLIEPVELKADK